MLPDPMQLAQMIEDSQTLRRRLNHLTAAQIAQDLEELHRLLSLVQREYGDVDTFIDRLRTRS